MIYLCPEVRSGLGEDTFWTWFAREFPDSTFDPAPRDLQPDDVVLQYSTLGAPSYTGGVVVALLWELHPEMAAQLGGGWDDVIARIRACADACDRRVVASPFMTQYYAGHGSIDVLPIGVDADLFRPGDKHALRERLGLPQDRRIGFWGGTSHPMKGSAELRAYAEAHPEIYWVIVWKTAGERGAAPAESSEYVLRPQAMLADLMGASDFMLSTTRLRPYFMIEWEAMACDLPLVVVGSPREFSLTGSSRDELLRRGWSRVQAKASWRAYLDDLHR